MTGNSFNKLVYRVEFYDKNNVLLLNAGHAGGNTTKEFILKDDERIVGVKSKHNASQVHFAVIFIIGKLV